MDLDELRSVQSKERRKDSLQHLRDSFYEDVADYLAERKRRRDERANAVDNPFSDEQVRKLSDEIETAEEVVESLYQRRVGKVVKLSSFAAAGAPTDTDGMTIQEAELFEDLVVRIEQNKTRVLDVLENGADLDVDVAADPPEATEAAVAGAEGAPAAEAGSDADPAPDAVSAPADESTDGAPTPPPDTPDATAAGDDGGLLADAMGGDAAADDGSADAAGTADATTAADAPATPTTGGGPTGGDADAGTDGGPGEFVPGSEPDRTDGGAATATAADPDADPAPTDGPADDHAPTDAAADDAGTDRRTVRVTRDVGEILGVDDIAYDLAAEDVVSLPSENAGPLVERDAAEPVE